MGAIDAWHELVEARNPDGLNDLLADEVVFHSPVIHSPQKGKIVTTMYLTAALHVLGNDTFRYIREIVGASDAALEFATTVDGIEINGVDLVSWNDSGKITDFKVMLRPLKAVNLVREMMAKLLEK